MEEIKNKLRQAAVTILADIGKETKAARARVRKATLIIAKEGKDYRRESLRADKA